MRKISNVFVFLFTVLVMAPGANIKAAEYYQGKSIKIVVGFTSGGFYDRWARLLARFMPKYIPGNPEMIVQICRVLAASSPLITPLTLPHPTA